MSNNFLRLALLIGVLQLISACTRFEFSQKRVHYSEHDVQKGQLASLSYPAELRASTISFGIDPRIPDEKLNELLVLRKSLEQKQSELSGIPKTDSQRRGALSTEIETLAGRLSEITRVWVYPRILAEPPPDVTVSAKLEIKAKIGKESGDPLDVGVDLGNSINQIRLATESDVKRHMAYRLNEALFNEPALIGPQYSALMDKIVSYKTDAAGPLPDTQSKCPIPKSCEADDNKKDCERFRVCLLEQANSPKSVQ